MNKYLIPSCFIECNGKYEYAYAHRGFWVAHCFMQFFWSYFWIYIVFSRNIDICISTCPMRFFRSYNFISYCYSSKISFEILGKFLQWTQLNNFDFYFISTRIISFPPYFGYQSIRNIHICSDENSNEDLYFVITLFSIRKIDLYIFNHKNNTII